MNISESKVRHSDLHKSFCGCGEFTKGGRFHPGHDTKLRAAFEEAVGGIAALRKIVEQHVGHPVRAKTENKN